MNRILAALPALGIFSAATATAQFVAQIDFSDGDGAYSGTNAPADTGSSDWTTVDNPSNDAFPVGALTIDLGRAPNDFSGTASFKDSRDPEEISGSGSGIFGTSLTQDAMTSTVTNGANPRGPLGVAINGLAAGIYDIYVVPHYAGNTGTEFVVGIGTLDGMPTTSSGDTTTFQFGTYPDAEATISATNITTWEEGNNYALGQVTIDATETVLGVYVGSLNPGGTAFDSDQVTLAAIQIIEVSEASGTVPAITALIAEDGGQDYFAVRYVQPTGGTGATGVDYEKDSVSYVVEVNDDLSGPWQSGPSGGGYNQVVEIEPAQDNGDGTETVTVRMGDPLDTSIYHYARLVVSP